MDDGKTQDLLLQLLQDIAVIKAKLDAIEEIKLDAKTIGVRVDHLEAQNREHDKSIRSLENRANTMEQFTRNNMVDSKKQMTSVYISIGMALFSAALSVVINLF
jgi:phosphopantetheine adenylyltransferase